MSSYPITSPRGQQMLAYLPRYYETSRVMRSLMQAEGSESDELRRALNETLDQYFISTATWGLDAWETELGVKTDPGKPEDERRSVLKSKVRGVGTVNIGLIQNVAEAYSRGTVEVTDGVQPYTFQIKFIDALGTPPNLDDLKAAMEEIKPAHLDVEYAFRYFMLGEIEAQTIAQLEATYLDQFAWG